MSLRLKTNNLDLLRCVFASTVMLVHAHVLSGEAVLAPLSQWLSSEVAVKAFFVISGFLVFMSFENSKSLAAYAEKRVRRIYPAYFTVVAGAALLLYFFSTAPAGAYIPGALKYLAANLVFLNFVHPTLPGVFQNNLLPEVNGALWTLKIEVMFYASVPLLAWSFRRLGRLRVLVAVYLLSVAYVWAMGWLARSTGSAGYEVLARQIPGQMSYFMVGAFFYYYFAYFERRVAWFVGGALLAGLLGRFIPGNPLEPLWLGTLVVFFGFYLYVGKFGRYGDFSYGIYILHFPILQALIHFGLFSWSPVAALAIAVLLVLACAAALWHFVEKPALNPSSHYTQVAGSRESKRAW